MNLRVVGGEDVRLVKLIQRCQTAGFELPNSVIAVMVVEEAWEI
jgi:hypothetical protein